MRSVNKIRLLQLLFYVDQEIKFFLLFKGEQTDFLISGDFGQLKSVCSSLAFVAITA
jgi:hypothetical protein